ncbi:hypothetical protein BGZ65_012416, partial [Modicella reniformis]
MNPGLMTSGLHNIRPFEVSSPSVLTPLHTNTMMPSSAAPASQAAALPPIGPTINTG